MYCGNCNYFEPDDSEDLDGKGYCRLVRGKVWGNDKAHDDEEGCIEYSEPEQEQEQE